MTFQAHIYYDERNTRVLVSMPDGKSQWADLATTSSRAGVIYGTNGEEIIFNDASKRKPEYFNHLDQYTYSGTKATNKRDFTDKTGK